MDEDRLVREVELPVGSDEVWEALTDAGQVAAWFGAEVDWELRPGGPARFREDGGGERRGEVDEVVPGRRLRFRWWDDEDASAVTYDLEPVPAGTRLVVTEVRLAGAPAPTASADVLAWDLRLLGLWLGCRPGARVGVGVGVA